MKFNYLIWYSQSPVSTCRPKHNSKQMNGNSLIPVKQRALLHCGLACHRARKRPVAEQRYCTINLINDCSFSICTNVGPHI